MEVHDTLEDAPAAKKTKAFGAMVTLIQLYVYMYATKVISCYSFYHQIHVGKGLVYMVRISKTKVVIDVI